ncbi:hypothetical protein SELMODRAFT_420074 [Selaginella moellendorffii]|uniref:Uncharacterized protein n=1 Tax=Selaginella moellendorffii TaxID=88036 RepID=D8SAG5_SELML|nr:hypothetical protein SELMODRAFT_420074 [Selaginella moellendorffii]
MGSYSKQGHWQLGNSNIPIQCYEAQALKEKDVREFATNTLTTNDDPLVIKPFLRRLATLEPNQDKNNEEKGSVDEEDIFPLLEETLPTQDNMNITGVEEQSDGGDEPHQGSPKTSLSPKIVALGHVANRPIIVYDSDGRGFEDYDCWSINNDGLMPPMHLMKLFSEPLRIVPTSSCYSMRRDLHRNWAAAQQLRELFNTTETLYYKFYHFCIEKAMLQPYKLAHTHFMPSCILIAPNNEFSCFQFAFNTNLHTLNYKVVYASEIGGALVWEESTIDAGGPYAKSIKEAIRQILRSTHGLFVLKEGATYWHPRMPVHSRTLRQEKWDVVSCRCTIATLAIVAGEVLDENDRQLARRGLYEMDLKASTPHIWNALNQLRGYGGMRGCGGLALPIHQAKYSGRLTLRWPPTLNVHGSLLKDFGENFRSWIVDIIQDMSLKELSKFLHFVVDSPEFRPREPIWIQVKR